MGREDEEGRKRDGEGRRGGEMRDDPSNLFILSCLDLG